MPYHLRLSEEEVRKELACLGYTEVAEETVASMRKDLLRLIKNDLCKLKQERQLREDSHTSSYTTGDVYSPLKFRGHKKPPLPPDTSTPVANQDHTQHGSMVVSSQTLSWEVSSNSGESGYSDTENTSSSYSHRTRDKRPSLKERVQDTHSVTGSGGGGERRKGKGDDGPGQHPRPHTIDKTTIDPVPRRAHERRKEAGNGKQSVCTTSVKTKKDKDMPAYPARPDPVNLYHFYKAHWDKFKVPGEDPRSKLRWALRTKLFYAE